MRSRVRLAPPDFWLLGTVLVLVTVGVWLVFDASYAKAADARTMNYDPWYLVKRQAAFAVIGLGCMALVARARFDLLRKAAVPLTIIAFALLLAVLAPSLGHKAHGARSWFKVGSFYIQPSEIAKVAILLYLASALAGARTFARRAPRRWAIPACVCAALVAVVVVERDLGGAGLMTLFSFVMFYTAGAKKRYLALAALVGVMLAAGAIYMMPHTKARFRAFADPWQYRYGEGYQTVHALAGLGTGGLRGVGLCEGREKFYQPAASTDYIFVTLGEETGLVGSLLLLGGFVLFTYRGLHIACRSKSSYGGLLAVGVAALVSIQVLINLAVVTASIPPTGLPLPFISYGGSAMVSMLVCVGVLLAVSRQVDVAVEERELDESSNNRRRHGRSHISRYQRRPGGAGSGSERRAAVRR